MAANKLSLPFIAIPAILVVSAVVLLQPFMTSFEVLFSSLINSLTIFLLVCGISLLLLPARKSSSHQKITAVAACVCLLAMLMVLWSMDWSISTVQYELTILTERFVDAQQSRTSRQFTRDQWLVSLTGLYVSILLTAVLLAHCLGILPNIFKTGIDFRGSRQLFPIGFFPAHSQVLCNNRS